MNPTAVLIARIFLVSAMLFSVFTDNIELLVFTGVIYLGILIEEKN